MAQTYKINHKRYEFVNVDSATTTAYLLSEADFNKWIKVDTTTTSVDIQMPDGLSEGFRCIIENTGVFTVNYINGVGTSIATQQDNLTEDQYRTVEVVFNNTEWRLQGYVGRNDISSLYDVNTDATGVPNDGDVLQYDFNAGIWAAAPQPPFFDYQVQTIDFILAEEDHGKIIPVDTTVLPVDVALNLGLPAGFKVRLINIGTGDITITAAPTLNISTTTITGQYTFVDIFHSGLETYYGVVNSVSTAGTALDYLKVNSTGTEASASGTGAIALGENVASSNTHSVAIGTNSAASLAGDVAIGFNSLCNSGTGVAVGTDSNAAASNAVAIGSNADSTGISAIAIGDTAVATALDSIQLGTGTNNSSSTLKYLTRTIANDEGILARSFAGIPGAVASDGNLAVDTSADQLYFYSSAAWHPAAGGASFISVDTAGGTPNLTTSTEAIAIGGNVVVQGSNSTVVIGHGANISGGNGAAEALVVGDGAAIATGITASTASVVLGPNAFVSNADEAVALGSQATIAANNAMALGARTDVATTAINGVAIGYQSTIDGAQAVALGPNTTANGADSVAIGNTTASSGANSVAIGPNSSATTASAIGIGNNADATASGAVQLGTGVNSTANSLKLQSLVLATTSGLIITDTNGVPVDTPAIGTARFDDTANILYIYNGGSWVSTTLT